MRWFDIQIELFSGYSLSRRTALLKGPKRAKYLRVHAEFNSQTPQVFFKLFPKSFPSKPKVNSKYMRTELNTQEYFTTETNQEIERPKRLASMQQVFLVKYLQMSIITSTILLVLIRFFIQIFKSFSCCLIRCSWSLQ